MDLLDQQAQRATLAPQVLQARQGQQAQLALQELLLRLLAQRDLRGLPAPVALQAQQARLLMRLM